jgi:hypothetical protein
MSDRVIGPVGTTLLLENDRVRIWEIALAPSEKSATHRRENVPREPLAPCQLALETRVVTARDFLTSTQMYQIDPPTVHARRESVFDGGYVTEPESGVGWAHHRAGPGEDIGGSSAINLMFCRARRRS